MISILYVPYIGKIYTKDWSCSVSLYINFLLLVFELIVFAPSVYILYIYSLQNFLLYLYIPELVEHKIFVFYQFLDVCWILGINFLL